MAVWLQLQAAVVAWVQAATSSTCGSRRRGGLDCAQQLLLQQPVQRVGAAAAGAAVEETLYEVWLGSHVAAQRVQLLHAMVARVEPPTCSCSCSSPS